MKSVYTLVLLLIVLLSACTKKQTAPHHSLQLHVDDNDTDIQVENIDAAWDSRTGELNILAEGTEHQLLKVHINTLQTAQNTQPGISDVYYTEDDGFIAARITNGEINTTATDNEHAEGTLHVTFANQANTDTKTISGHFVIYSMHR